MLKRDAFLRPFRPRVKFIEKIKSELEKAKTGV
jgi:hypothetical protein